MYTGNEKGMQLFKTVQENDLFREEILEKIEKYEKFIEDIKNWQHEKYNPINKDGRINCLSNSNYITKEGSCKFYLKKEDRNICALTPLTIMLCDGSYWNGYCFCSSLKERKSIEDILEKLEKNRKIIMNYL